MARAAPRLSGLGYALALCLPEFEPLGGGLLVEDVHTYVRIKETLLVSRDVSCGVAVYRWGRGSEVFSICMKRSSSLAKMPGGRRLSYSPQVELFCFLYKINVANCNR